MRVSEIDSETEGTFFRCLHDEKPDIPQVAKIRRQWFSEFQPKGLRGKVLIADNEDVVGLCQFLPIEHSPFAGKDLMAILCMWIHGYDHHIGNQQGKGYGRFLLAHVEEDARLSGKKGIAVWGKDFPFWNPISFYEHMGYSRADSEGQNILAWKAFDDTAEAPTIKRRLPPRSVAENTIGVTAYQCGWCSSEIGCCRHAQEAVEGMEGIADYSRIDISSPSLSPSLFLDDLPYRPDGPPFSIEDLRDDIKKLYEAKKSRGHGKPDADEDN